MAQFLETFLPGNVCELPPKDILRKFEGASGRIPRNVLRNMGGHVLAMFPRNTLGCFYESTLGVSCGVWRERIMNILFNTCTLGVQSSPRCG